MTEERRERERLKKARQRQGYTVLPVPVHLPSLTWLLLTEGLLSDKDIEDPEAISEAAGVHFRNHQHVGRILRDKTPPKETSRHEIKKLPAPWHPAQHTWEEQKAQRKKWQKEQLEQDLREGIPSDAYFNRHDRLGSHGGHLISSTPPDWSDRGKGGNSKGRNPGLLTGATGGTPCPRKSKKKIKQLKPAELEKLEKPFGKLTPPDTGIHTAKVEVEAKLDDLEWQKLGYARRKTVVDLDHYDAKSK
jgi:hypothetical protein